MPPRDNPPLPPAARRARALICACAAAGILLPLLLFLLRG